VDHPDARMLDADLKQTAPFGLAECNDGVTTPHHRANRGVQSRHPFS
jgi:hypothetical protein